MEPKALDEKDRDNVEIFVKRLLAPVLSVWFGITEAKEAHPDLWNAEIHREKMAVFVKHSLSKINFMFLKHELFDKERMTVYCNTGVSEGCELIFVFFYDAESGDFTMVSQNTVPAA